MVFNHGDKNKSVFCGSVNNGLALTSSFGDRDMVRRHFSLIQIKNEVPN
jgi:hypothetical protein